MNFCRRRFNLYLLMAATGLLVCGCLHPHGDKKKPVGILRLHVESETSTAGSTKGITVLRSEPVSINITTDPVLTEADVVSARLITYSSGSFGIEIKFDETAGWRLEQYTAINPGKHLVVFAQWSDKQEDGRWLAAPLIVKRMAGGVLNFSPDASKEEMEQWVTGLNAKAKKNAARKAKE